MSIYLGTNLLTGATSASGGSGGGGGGLLNVRKYSTYQSGQDADVRAITTDDIVVTINGVYDSSGSSGATTIDVIIPFGHSGASLAGRTFTNNGRSYQVIGGTATTIEISPGSDENGFPPNTLDVTLALVQSPVSSFNGGLQAPAGGITAGVTSAVLRGQNNTLIGVIENQFVGLQMETAGATQTVTVTANTGLVQDGTPDQPITVTFTPALNPGVNPNFPLNFVTASIPNAPYYTTQLARFNTFLTVNPATDLGLEDGDLLGYFMVGGGGTGEASNSQTATTSGGLGGRILQGSTVISTAATDLILTIGTGLPGGTTNGNGTASTITGGLTLSTSNGNQTAGARGNAFSSQSLGIGAAAPGPGIHGYGSGGGSSRAQASSRTGYSNVLKHGFGAGGEGTSESGDGAIILIY